MMLTSNRKLVSAVVQVATLAVVAASASAADLTVSSVEIIQSVKFANTKLIGDNLTWVRVKVGVLNSASAIAGVDASLRMSVNGVPMAGPPIFSLNGPITAPLSPNSVNVNDTINFAVIPPISNDVDFLIEVNPGRTVVEDSYLNNTFSALNNIFECRKVCEVASVAINYTPGGGLPPANLIAPGIGDGFVRGIFKAGEWNFHRSVVPLTWTQNINGSNNSLLNTLRDIRLNQLPVVGQPQPQFVYGWLPGNPYSGNGQAIGIPGDAAFGNTDSSRHQRTCAHELGHCFGLPHNNTTILTVGVDVEHHLKDTQNLAQTFATNKNDIMVAGLLTNQAWVNQNTTNVVLADGRLSCANDGEPAMVPVLRISGVINHETRQVQFDPIMWIERGVLDSGRPDGDLTIAAFDPTGQQTLNLHVRTDTAREMCVLDDNGNPIQRSDSPFNVLIPETIADKPIGEIRLIDRVSGQVLASRIRSTSMPQIALSPLQSIQVGQVGNPGKPHGGPAPAMAMVRASWTGSDADGDSLTYNLLYSHNGGSSWLPLVVNSTSNSFDFNASDLPDAQPGNGRLRLVASDGLNNQFVESGIAGSLGGGNPPETYVITPNNAAVFPQKAPVAFHAAAWDVTDGMIADSNVQWASSIDGPIGSGRLMINSNLSPGTHTIIVTATDSSQASSSAQVLITITPRVVINPDCNANGVLDSIDISSGSSIDANSNGVPDECETLCIADVTGNGVVNVDDLLMIINAWGPCPGSCPPHCPADINDNCQVNVDDLLSVINAWGACP